MYFEDDQRKAWQSRLPYSLIGTTVLVYFFFYWGRTWKGGFGSGIYVVQDPKLCNTLDPDLYSEYGRDPATRVNKYLSWLGSEPLYKSVQYVNFMASGSGSETLYYCSPGTRWRVLNIHICFHYAFRGIGISIGYVNDLNFRRIRRAFPLTSRGWSSLASSWKMAGPSPTITSRRSRPSTWSWGWGEECRSSWKPSLARLLPLRWRPPTPSRTSRPRSRYFEISICGHLSRSMR